MSSIKIGKFLEPWQGPDAHELHHTIANPTGPSSIDPRYNVVGEVEYWQEFPSSNMSSSIHAALDKQFTPRWQGWLPDFARAIYNERQLECLYYSTLITRVNLALQHAIPSGHPQVTVVMCPGSFDSLGDGEMATTILPDWVVIEGPYTQNGRFPNLETLVLQRKIIAVGDTKLVRLRENADAAQQEARDAKDFVASTHSCHASYLAQVQHYAHMLGTRFAFILTNEELLLAQFLRETEASPRLPSQRGLRSSTLPHRLRPGLPIDFRSSDPLGPEDDIDEQERVHTPPPRHKRRHESSDSPGLPRPDPPHTGYSGMPSSPPDRAFLCAHDRPPSSPSPALRGRESMADQALGSSHLPQSSPHWLSTSQKNTSSSGNLYEPPLHDFEIGKALVRSIRIPYREKENGDEETEAMHPAKALFTLLMHSYSVGPQGRSMEEEEIGS